MRTTELIRFAQRAVFLLSALFLFGSAALAQTTGFTYQGKLSDGGSPANGSYDLELRLFDVPAGGAALGTQQKPAVVATAGIFTVQLDFGLSAFAGPPRYLEIGVRPAGSPNPYTVLSPRQPVTSTPYAVRSLNASAADTLSSACVGCVTSTQIGSVSASTITGTIPPASLPADSAAYVQNTSSPQAGSNFNISGTGTAGLFNTATQYNIGGARMLSAPGTNNLLAGAGAGNANTGTNNAFFGPGAGLVNSSGNENSFFGSFAGASNTTAARNSFFGYRAGASNWTAINNSFFGALAGLHNVSGSDNSFFGREAGASNVDANGNSYFGAQAGVISTGRNNSFFGAVAGALNTTGFNNSFFGYQAGYFNESGIENSFFGKDAGVHSKGNSNSFFGNEAGALNSSGTGNTFIGAAVGGGNTTGNDNTVVGHGADVGSGNLSFATALGAGALVNASNTVVLGRTGDNVIVPGNLFVESLGVGGSTNICTTPAGKIATCSSSLRYKTSVHSFSGGLDIVRRLSPISFTWKDGGQPDLGLGAEEVAKVEPRLTFRNKQGEIEGVRYNQLSAVLINAVKEQQAQITAQQRTIEQQQQQLKRQQDLLQALKLMVCQRNKRPKVCK